jgi:hypothetical protein
VAVSINQSGSQTATINTEHTLGSAITTAGIYQYLVDIANLAAGDIVELRIYGKVRSSDTERLMFGPVTYGPIPPSVDIAVSPAVVTAASFKATLKQVAGTGRAFPWAIYSTGA